MFFPGGKEGFFEEIIKERPPVGIFRVTGGKKFPCGHENRRGYFK